MILEVFDKSFVRIGVINEYDFANYTTRYKEVGSFNLKVPRTEENVMLLVRENYILLDTETMGVIENVSKQDDEDEYLLEISGNLIEQILTRRIFDSMQTFKGQEYAVIEQFLTNNFISPSNPLRRIANIRLSTEQKYKPQRKAIEKQVTGSNVCEEIINICQSSTIGFALVPIISTVDDGNNDIVTNISSLEYRTLLGSDRSIGNTAGNDEVKFSKSFNNLLRATYEVDDTEYKNVALVAGEGEGAARKYVYVGNTNVSGIDRRELFVDARDLQSTKDDDTQMTEQEYIENLKQRGLEKLAENIIVENYDGEISKENNEYVYGKDFFLGDTVSIIDNELNIEIKAKISEVTISEEVQGKHTDIVFGEKKIIKLL